MPFIEAPTNFYLGRRYDPLQNQLDDDVVYYDSRDLTTHAVVVGMTGSGKTGLCITLLEEAILDNLPAIIIDPKGDITNLLLTFPDMRPEDFQPWVNQDDVRRAGVDLHQYSVDLAQRWRDGLQSWGIVPDRLRWLQRATQYSIFTPGSDSGLPVNILASLAAPRDGWAGNEEPLREQINGITTALLALIGINAEPVKDKEHVLIANIFEYAWQRGINLTLEDIIIQVQNPPFNKLGALPIDEYISQRLRAKLAMQLNSIIAAPSFQSWINGHPMDIQRLLYQPNGRPRVSIFYIAHLNDAERMFIITLLLENMLGWMRQQSGTTSLRGLLYIDEMFGYFPPYPKNPPTKEPLLRLLKQARAFGLGLILATQNPGDLDYKGLSNAGTWFIGRLQSENDKTKMVAGFQSMADAQAGMNLHDVEQLISDIPPRVFLMRNVHNPEGPVMLHTRWAMNYLRGPLTRQQINLLMTVQRQQMIQSQPVVPLGASQRLGVTGGFNVHAAPPPPPTLPGAPPALPELGRMTAQSAFPPPMPNQPTVSPSQAMFPVNPNDSQRTTMNTSSLPPGTSENRPALPASTTQYFLPNTITAQQAVTEWERRMGFRAQSLGGSALLYRPVLLAQSTVRYQDKKAQVYTARTYAFQVTDLQRTGIVHWEEYESRPVDSRMITSEPTITGRVLYEDMPPGLTDSARMTALKREIVDMLYSTAKLGLPHNPVLGVFGKPEESFDEFAARVNQTAREERDREMDKISEKYGTQLEKLEDTLRKTEQDIEAEKKELSDRRREELFTTGEALFTLWKGSANYTLSRMSRAQRFRRQSKESIDEGYTALRDTEREIEKLEAEFQQMLAKINDKWAQIAAQTQEYLITPFKKDIALEMFGIGWVPYWYMVINQQVAVLPAVN
ncbi:MAG: DUF87 domain-containing protein [Anaerolineae bacterium]|nr:DUF87 domain-containing protein [Anaerolineae bacterium]